MKVYALRCTHGHEFEGWFGSDEVFAQQQEEGLIDCPWCADKCVVRVPGAPRLNLSGARDSGPARNEVASAPPQSVQALQLAWLKMVRKVLSGTEDVGDRFPEEARRIHYGETAARGIRGQATPEERDALADEGIEVTALPLPEVLKGPAH